MLSTSLFAILFITVCIVSLVSGILVMQSDRTSRINRAFFALVICLIIWTLGLTVSTVAPNLNIAIAGQRISAFGWVGIYVILVLFVLLLTGRKLHRTCYPLLFIPSLLMILVYGLPSNLYDYSLVFTRFGWSSSSVDTFWDYAFYAYFSGYTLLGLYLVAAWRTETEKTAKKQILFSLLVAFLVGTLTDVLLPAFGLELPQLAPIILTIPVVVISQVLRSRNPQVVGLGAPSRYTTIFILVALYVFISVLQTRLSADSELVAALQLEESTFRGIITQLQMFISIYLVLRAKKTGVIATLLLNGANLVSSILFLIRTNSPTPIPGIISYIGVLLVIYLIRVFEQRSEWYISHIDTQRSELEQSQNKLYNMAFYDSLTRLPNRDYFIDHVNQTIAKHSHGKQVIGILFLDFDSFKSINDTAGHATGDLVLSKIAEVMAAVLDKDDIIARFGGDEFLMEVQRQKETDILLVTKAIMQALKRPIVIDSEEYFLPASIGVSLYPNDGPDAQTLIMNADIAMYAAKAKGKNQVAYCTEEMKAQTTKRLRLTNSLYRALDRNELFIEYQPQICTETRKVCGFEALLRWKNPDYGIVLPADFIPLAEQTGLIRPIGLFVLKEACKQLVFFNQTYQEALVMSINLSLVQLRDAHIVEKVRAILAETGVDSTYLQIEVTESSNFLGEPLLLQRLIELKQLGISLAIDDFGTGHSSFSRLRTYPIDQLKIDIEFVQGITTGSKKDMALIKSIIQTAKNLGIEVLAEGVETEEQVQYLQQNGCDKLQGYYFSKPLKVEDIAGSGLLTPWVNNQA